MHRDRLDALYFMLYFPSGSPAEVAALRDTVTYIYSTFPIVEWEVMASHGRYLSRDLCLAHFNALAAGDPDTEIEILGVRQQGTAVVFRLLRVETSLYRTRGIFPSLTLPKRRIWQDN